MNGQKTITPTPTVLTPRLCKAARALLGWKQEDLSMATGIGVGMIRHFEAETRPTRRPLILTMERAFTDAGLEFDRGGVVFRELLAA
jgi:transcriptional regulator with XRE-family HTH domain